MFQCQTKAWLHQCSTLGTNKLIRLPHRAMGKELGTEHGLPGRYPPSRDDGFPIAVDIKPVLFFPCIAPSLSLTITCYLGKIACNCLGGVADFSEDSMVPLPPTHTRHLPRGKVHSQQAQLWWSFTSRTIRIPEDGVSLTWRTVLHNRGTFMHYQSLWP